MTTLVFDTETTGLVNRGLPFNHPSQPHLVQLGAILYDEDRKVRAEANLIINEKVPIPQKAVDVHGIDQEVASRFGVYSTTSLAVLRELVRVSDRIAAYNASYDLDIIAIERTRQFMNEYIRDVSVACAMLSASKHMKIPGRHPGSYAWPKLQEAYKALVSPNGFDGAHDAMADVRACAEVLWALEDAGAEIVTI